jgi:hypothetical protein
MTRRIAFGALFLALACLFCVPPAAADSPFTVSGVHVDASAASVVEARNAAIAAGREQAWQMLFRRITRQQDWTRQPALDPAALQKLVSSFLPLGEKRSTTRYVAEVTYIFSPEAVARLLQSAGIAYTSAQARRVLVIPMAPGYAHPSPWAQALSNPRLMNGLVPFVLPLGDGRDLTALAGLSFETAGWAAVEPVAARQHAGEVVLIQATVSGRKMTVNLRRLGPNEIPVKAAAEVPLLQGANATYPAAADVAVRSLEDLWKTRSALDFAQKGKLTVTVEIASLAGFAALENALAAVPNVSNASVNAIDIGEAQMALSYLGSIEQLREALGQAGLTLSRSGGVWRLTQSATASQP